MRLTFPVEAQTAPCSAPQEASGRSRSLFWQLAIASLLALAACSKAPPPAEPVRAVRTTTLGLGEAGGSHRYAAEIRARSETRLAFRVGGRLAQRPVALGDAVKAGQLLAELDAQDLRLGQEAAQQAWVAAQVNAQQAQADLERFKALREQGFISGAELERRSTASNAAIAQANQAKAQLALQGNQSGYSRLVAQAAGVVTAVDADPGTVLAAGTPVLRVAWDGPRDVVFSVPEDRIAAMRALEGKPGALSVQLWGDGQALPATLRELSAAADGSTRTFLAKADIGRAAVTLGQTATVSVALPAQPGVVKLPLTAVFQAQGQTAVWLLEPKTMTVRQQAVQVAGADGNEVVLKSGLSAGQEVVTAGVHLLTPGQKVTRYQAAPASGARP
jgi:membrane fusion protein, multidrug efflux system